jgi:hypothetical protein
VRRCKGLLRASSFQQPEEEESKHKNFLYSNHKNIKINHNNVTIKHLYNTVTMLHVTQSIINSFNVRWKPDGIGS